MLNSFLLFMLILVILSQSDGYRTVFSRDKDDTDPVNGRSGLVLYTDAKTKLQYLSTPGGGLTPRLDNNGKHMKGFNHE
jgi:hypothetical protein